ncbi:MAG: methyltransferase domain-containing protein [Polyangia bacterium]
MASDRRLEALRDPEAFRKWNEEMAQKYDPEAYHAHPNPAVRFVEGLRVRRLLELLEVRPGDRVLEVGCGAGNILEQIGPGAELHGVDLSPFLLEKAARRLGPRAVLQQGFAEKLPYADASFDRVYCSEVLEHVLDPGAVLAELRRVVKPGGRVVVSFPNEHLIDRVKDGLRRLGLWRLFAGRSAGAMAGAGGGTYQAAERMGDEWHLHELSVEDVRRLVAGKLTIERQSDVPSRLFPLRHVVALRPVAG